MESENKAHCEALKKIITRLLLEKQKQSAEIRKLETDVKRLEGRNERLSNQLSIVASFSNGKPVDEHNDFRSVKARMRQIILWSELIGTPIAGMSKGLQEEYLALIGKSDLFTKEVTSYVDTVIRNEPISDVVMEYFLKEMDKNEEKVKNISLCNDTEIKEKRTPEIIEEFKSLSIKNTELRNSCDDLVFANLK